jgi:hypothetical protein
MVQRTIMNAIIATKRIVYYGVLKTWMDWVVRSTAVAEKVMAVLRIPDWVEGVYARRFRGAGCTARLEDKRWTREVSLWSTTGSRRRGRPQMCWTKQLNRFFRQGPRANRFWLQHAADVRSWCPLEDDYVNFAFGRLAEI